jgi:hypothetical protein
MVAIELGDGLMRFILGAMKDMPGIPYVRRAPRAGAGEKKVMLAPIRGESTCTQPRCREGVVSVMCVL